MKKIFQQTLRLVRRVADAMSAKPGEGAGRPVFSGAKVSSELLHQNVVLFGLSRSPPVRNLSVEKTNRPFRRRLFGDKSKTVGGAPVGRVDDKDALSQCAHIEGGRAGFGTDTINTLQPGQGIIDRPAMQEIETETPAQAGDLLQGTGQGNGFAIRMGNAFEQGIQFVKRSFGQPGPGAFEPCHFEMFDKPDKHRQCCLIACSGAKHRQKHLTDRIETHESGGRSEDSQQALMEAFEPIERHKRQSVLHPRTIRTKREQINRSMSPEWGCVEK
nr:hypothetical protein [Nitratireductor sp.]